MYKISGKELKQIRAHAKQIKECIRLFKKVTKRKPRLMELSHAHADMVVKLIDKNFLDIKT